MDNFDTVLNATKDDYENYILSNPLLEVLASGRMTRIHYIGYLRETYHLVRARGGKFLVNSRYNEFASSVRWQAPLAKDWTGCSFRSRPLWRLRPYRNCPLFPPLSR